MRIAAIILIYLVFATGLALVVGAVIRGVRDE